MHDTPIGPAEPRLELPDRHDVLWSSPPKSEIPLQTRLLVLFSLIIRQAAQQRCRHTSALRGAVSGEWPVIRVPSDVDTPRPGLLLAGGHFSHMYLFRLPDHDDPDARRGEGGGFEKLELPARHGEC